IEAELSGSDGRTARAGAGPVQERSVEGREMSQSETLIDKISRKICEWFDDIFPGGHAVATVGYNLAGLRAGMPLPFDPNWRPPQAILMPNPGNANDNGNAKHVKTGKAGPESSCEFWAYNHTSGNLSVW